MTDIQHVFQKDSLKRVLSSLGTLPERLMPKYFGYDEDIYSREDLVNDDARFELFLQSAESGFFPMPKMFLTHSSSNPPFSRFLFSMPAFTMA